MTVLKTARQQTHERITGEILRVGRDQLGAVGAAALSLRAVARELGMVSSAIYRYVESRDALLTLLIDDAYNSLGAAVEADVMATSNASSDAHRWVSAANVVRTWAIAHPNEYALLYGSPVPGYVAPQITTRSGTRASRALITIVADAARGGRLRARPNVEPGVGSIAAQNIAPELVADFDLLRANVDLGVDDAVVVDLLIAWSQLFGLVSFELFGQTRGVVQHHDALFEHTARRLAGLIGLAGEH